MDLFIIFLVVVSQVHAYCQTHKIVYIKHMQFFNLSSAVKKKQKHFSCGQQNLSLSSWLPCPSHCCSVLKWQTPSPRVVEGAWFRMCGGGGVVWAVRTWAGLLGVILLAIIALVTPVLNSGNGCSVSLPHCRIRAPHSVVGLCFNRQRKGSERKLAPSQKRWNNLLGTSCLNPDLIQTSERTPRVTLSLSWMISTFRSSDPSVGALPGLWQQQKTVLSPALVEFPPGLRRNTFHVSLDHWVAGSSPAFFAVFGT